MVHVGNTCGRYNCDRERGEGRSAGNKGPHAGTNPQHHCQGEEQGGPDGGSERMHTRDDASTFGGRGEVGSGAIGDKPEDDVAPQRGLHHPQRGHL